MTLESDLVPSIGSDQEGALQTIHGEQEQKALVFPPIRKGRLLALLTALESLEDPFPDGDEDLPPMGEVTDKARCPIICFLSALRRHPLRIVAARFAKAGEETACTSIVVAARLRLGAVESGSKKPAYWVDLILSALKNLPLEMPADRRYGD